MRHFSDETLIQQLHPSDIFYKDAVGTQPSAPRRAWGGKTPNSIQRAPRSGRPTVGPNPDQTLRIIFLGANPDQTQGVTHRSAPVTPYTEVEATITLDLCAPLCHTMSRARAFVFTINNYSANDTAAVIDAASSAAYLCYAPEVGDSGTPHLQGYVRWPQPKTIGAACTALGGRAHVELAKGTDQDSRTYIFGPYSKDGHVKEANPEAVEFGELARPGKRKDLDVVRELIKDGGSIKQVIEQTSSFQGLSFAMKAIPYFEPKRSFVTEVYWFWGATGTGKSKAAWEEAGPDAYSPVSYKWWDGYDGHEHVILDDIRSDFCSFNQFLQLFDRYPLRVECKGGSRQLLAKKIWVTSPYDPPAFFQMESEAISQLTRRITLVRAF